MQKPALPPALAHDHRRPATLLGIRVTYEMPGLPSPQLLRIEARDDRAQELRDLGGAMSHTITRGFLTFRIYQHRPRPLHVHMSWSLQPSLQQGPALQLRIAL